MVHFSHLFFLIFSNLHLFFLYKHFQLPPQSEVVIPDVIRTLNLTEWIQTCEAFQLEVAAKLDSYSLKAAQVPDSGNTLICPLDGTTNAIIGILKSHELNL